MSRGPEDVYLGIRAVIDRALLQGAAPVAAGGASSPTPAFGNAVAETAPARRVEGPARTKPARSFTLAKTRKRAAQEAAAPDPHGRGARVDVRR